MTFGTVRIYCFFMPPKVDYVFITSFFVRKNTSVFLKIRGYPIFRHICTAADKGRNLYVTNQCKQSDFFL